MKETANITRKLNPEDILLPQGYKIEVFSDGLNVPINLVITDEGEMLLADSGVTDNNGKVLKLTNEGWKVIADKFNMPLTGINYYKGKIYVSHRGFITTIDEDGNRTDILSGLPSFGDHHNNRVVFGADGKMYFGQGTATNSGVVGLDNTWFKDYPFFCDYPGSNITLNGQNFDTRNPLSASANDYACTGAYTPFNTTSYPGETIKGSVRASGGILRANPDGSDLELLAWGLRNPFRIKFDVNGNLYVANHGMDVRGSRPVDNSPDEFWLLQPGTWYGWPDFTGGLPVTMPIFKPDNEPQPQFLIANHPMIPPRPFAVFRPHSAIMGFDFNYSPDFGPIGDAFIAEFGSEAPETTGGKPLPRVGHRVSRIDMKTGAVSNFAINRTGYAASYTGGGGLEKPIDVVISSGNSMYIVDFGLNRDNEPDEFIQNTGVIWKVSKA